MQAVLVALIAGFAGVLFGAVLMRSADASSGGFKQHGQSVGSVRRPFASAPPCAGRSPRAAPAFGSCLACFALFELHSGVHPLAGSFGSKHPVSRRSGVANWCSWLAISPCSISRLTPPSSGRLPACFARFQSPLMSNVRRHRNHGGRRPVAAEATVTAKDIFRRKNVCASSALSSLGVQPSLACT